MGWWSDFKGEGLGRGVHKFDGTGDLAGHRFHIRNGDGGGVMIIDASSIVRLNGTAVDHMRCILENRSDKSTLSYMSHRYAHLDDEAVLRNQAALRDGLLRLLSGEGGLETVDPDRWSVGADGHPAPYRLDLILTYQCQNACGHCYNRPRPLQELSDAEWCEAIDRAWEAGIPHIVMSGGEPTMRHGLKLLIERSEANGQITGMVTNGRNLARHGYLAGLVSAGLDHVQITVLSRDPAAHDKLSGCKGAWSETIAGLKAALKEDLHVSTNTTLMAGTVTHAKRTLEFLGDLGVRNVSFNGLIRSGRGGGADDAPIGEVARLVPELRDMAKERGMRLTWFTPTPYCSMNPVELGLGIKQCTAASISMAVEPDGSVMPCQSWNRSAGNILTDDWASIWDSAMCRGVRSREYLDDQCRQCGMSELCGGGCPLSRERGDYDCRPFPRA